MRILAVNLKHLYQRRALWLIYLFLALPVAGMVAASASALGGKFDRAVFVLLFLSVSGLMLGTCQREVASRPFTFLLPRHTGVIPRQTLIQGALFSLLAPLCWLFSPQPSLSQHLGLLGATWLLGTACYMVGTVLGFVLPFVGSTLGSLPLVILGSSLLITRRVLDLAIRAHPASAAVLALGMIAWSWRRLGRRSLTRRWSGRRTMAFTDGLNLAKATQYHQWREANKGSDQPELGSRQTAHSCIEGIQASRPEGVRRYWHAVRYEWLGGVKWWERVRELAICTIFVFPMVGYIAGGKNSVILFIVPVTMMIRLRGSHATTLLPVGRRQRYALAVVGVLLLTALSACVIWPLVALSHAVAPLMPPLTLRATTLSFQPFPYVYALIPAILIPLAFAALTWLKKRTGGVMLVWMTLFPGVILLTRGPWSTPLAVWLALPLVSMLASLWALRHHCLRRDIV